MFSEHISLSYHILKNIYMILILCAQGCCFDTRCFNINAIFLKKYLGNVCSIADINFIFYFKILFKKFLNFPSFLLIIFLFDRINRE